MSMGLIQKGQSLSEFGAFKLQGSDNRVNPALLQALGKQDIGVSLAQPSAVDSLGGKFNVGSSGVAVTQPAVSQPQPAPEPVLQNNNIFGLG